MQKVQFVSKRLPKSHDKKSPPRPNAQRIILLHCLDLITLFACFDLAAENHIFTKNAYRDGGICLFFHIFGVKSAIRAFSEIQANKTEKALRLGHFVQQKMAKEKALRLECVDSCGRICLVCKVSTGDDEAGIRTPQLALSATLPSSFDHRASQIKKHSVWSAHINVGESASSARSPRETTRQGFELRNLR